MDSSTGSTLIGNSLRFAKGPGRFWLTMVLCAVVYLPALFWSLGLDQQIFAEIGWLLLHGRLPYLDVWDVKPPNIFYTYAAFEWLIGRSDFAVRAADYVAALLACGAMYRAISARVRSVLASDGMRRWAPATGALLLALTLLSVGLSDTAQTESFSLVLLTLGALWSLRTDRRSLIASGVMIAMATCYKSTNGVFLAALFVEIYFAGVHRGARLRNSLWLAAGFAGWMLVEVGFLWVTGTLGAYATITAEMLHRPIDRSRDATLLDMIRELWVLVDIWLAIGIGAVAVALGREDRKLLRLVRLPILYLVSALIAVHLQHKGWGYHYVIALPGLVSLGAIGVVYLADELRALVRRAVVPSVIVLCVATLVVTPSAHRRLHYSVDAWRSVTDHSAYLATLGAQQSLYYPPCTVQLAQYLRTHTLNTDSVFIFGEEPGAYWLSERTPASKHIYSLLFTSGVLTSDELRGLSDTVAARLPAEIVIERFDTTRFGRWPETSESLVATDPRFWAIRDVLDARYILADTVCGKFLAYMRVR